MCVRLSECEGVELVHETGKAACSPPPRTVHTLLNSTHITEKTPLKKKKSAKGDRQVAQIKIITFSIPTAAHFHIFAQLHGSFYFRYEP